MQLKNSIPAILILGTVGIIAGLFPTLLTSATKSGIQFIAFGLLAAAVLLSFLFRRGKTLFTALILALLIIGFDSPISYLMVDYHTELVFNLLQLIVPPLLVLIAVSPRRHILHPASIVWIVAIGLITIAVWAARYDSAFNRLVQRIFELQLISRWLPTEGLPYPEIIVGVGIFGLLIIILTDSIYHWENPLAAVWIGVYAAACFGLLTLASPLISTLWFAAAAGILTIALIQYAHRMAFLDALTMVPNRRALDEQLSRLRNLYAIAMVDIDFFKQFNDTHGHKTGDNVLRKTASQLQQVGGGGRVFRYGGEEFAIVFPGKTAREAGIYCEEIRKQIANEPFYRRGPKRPRRPPKHPPENRPSQDNTAHKLSITVSIGIAAPGSRAVKPEKILQQADNALYHAKKTGRNKVIIARQTG